MGNKKLFKFLSEIEKIDTHSLGFYFYLNRFQVNILLFLRKHKKCTIKYLVHKVDFKKRNKDFAVKMVKEYSRAQKYRLIDELISKKICKINNQYLVLNL